MKVLDIQTVENKQLKKLGIRVFYRFDRRCSKPIFIINEPSTKCKYIIDSVKYKVKTDVDIEVLAVNRGMTLVALCKLLKAVFIEASKNLSK